MNEINIMLRSVLLAQLQLELLESMQGTSVYRNDVKNACNRIIAMFDKHVSHVTKGIDNTETNQYVEITTEIEKLLNSIEITTKL